jgi:hypothetical protein
MSWDMTSSSLRECFLSSTAHEADEDGAAWEHTIGHLGHQACGRMHGS